MSAEILKEGYLNKESKHLATLRERWMVLKGTKLYSYKKMKIYTNPTEIIDLSEYDAILISKTAELARFELTSSLSNKTRVFLSSSMEELNDWLNHIMKIIKHSYSIKPIRDRPYYDFPMEDDTVVFKNTFNHLGELGLL
eukprot:304245_1